ncbi:MAG: ribonuclease P protein subunit [Halobacteriales archaeon]|nr:ribonuclease P protein subunit [Halobacteriales archaeon]
MITPRNVARHELVGLRCRVVDSADTSLVGIEGRVVEETTHTLVVETEDDEKTVQKKYTTFEFELPGKETDDVDDTTVVRVEGEAIDARPAERVRGV